MAFAWPASLTPQTVSWGIQKAALQSRSPMAGSVESIEFPGQFWRVSLTLPQRSIAAGTEGAAFFSRVSGGAERVLVPYWPRLTSLGSIRGSTTTVLSTAAVRGDLAVVLSGLPASALASLRAGDFFSIGGQLFQCFADAFQARGVATVPLVNRVRGPIASGSAVVWSAPTMTAVIPSTSFSAVFVPGGQQGIAVDLEEAA